MQGAVRVDHRLFPLEDVNHAPIPKRVVDAEIGVVGALAPEQGWKPWQGDASTWPISSLPANEAVHAAKAQSSTAAEELDMALRWAFFRDSRPITLAHEIVDIARGCPHVDPDAIRTALDEGTARAAMMRDYRDHAGEVKGSPHFFLPDGSNVHSPGIELRWVGEPGSGFPIIEADDPRAVTVLLETAATDRNGPEHP